MSELNLLPRKNITIDNNMENATLATVQQVSGQNSYLPGSSDELIQPLAEKERTITNTNRSNPTTTNTTAESTMKQDQLMKSSTAAASVSLPPARQHSDSNMDCNVKV